MEKNEVSELVARVKNGEVDPEAALAEFERAAYHISEVELGDPRIEVIPSGFESLDDYMLLKKGYDELIVFGADTSMGKSAFMNQVAHHVARTRNVLFFSLEMSAQTVVKRMLSQESGQTMEKLQKGTASPEELKRAKERLFKLNYFLNDQRGLDVGMLCAHALSVHRANPLSLIVVDYLQIASTEKHPTSKAEQVGHIALQLRALAQKVHCPVLVGSQLNREPAKRGKETKLKKGIGDYTPTLSDLSESSHVEKHADMVLLMYRQHKYDGTRPGEADVIVAKNRNGPVGNLLMGFTDKLVMFTDPKREGL